GPRRLESGVIQLGTHCGDGAVVLPFGGREDSGAHPLESRFPCSEQARRVLWLTSHSQDTSETSQAIRNVQLVVHLKRQAQPSHGQVSRALILADVQGKKCQVDEHEANPPTLPRLLRYCQAFFIGLPCEDVVARDDGNLSDHIQRLRNTWLMAQLLECG